LTGEIKASTLGYGPITRAYGFVGTSIERGTIVCVTRAVKTFVGVRVYKEKRKKEEN
jgi:hypothetical protein